MDGGAAPTVDEAARAASVSRATAYRYFPSRRALLVAAYPQLTAESLLGEDAPRDPAARLDLVLEGITRQMLEHEAVLRTMLRLSLDARTATPDDLPFRVGRRIVWVADALEPLRDELSEPARERLVLAIASAVGIDALVWLTDVAGLSRPEAVDLARPLLPVDPDPPSAGPRAGTARLCCQGRAAPTGAGRKAAGRRSVALPPTEPAKAQSISAMRASARGSSATPTGWIATAITLYSGHDVFTSEDCPTSRFVRCSGKWKVVKT